MDACRGAHTYIYIYICIYIYTYIYIYIHIPIQTPGVHDGGEAAVDERGGTCC